MLSEELIITNGWHNTQGPAKALQSILQIILPWRKTPHSLSDEDGEYYWTTGLRKYMKITAPSTIRQTAQTELLTSQVAAWQQNAGKGPSGHVQKGAAADHLYGVSLGTIDQCIVTQKPHRKARCTVRYQLEKQHLPAVPTGRISGSRAWFNQIAETQMDGSAAGNSQTMVRSNGDGTDGDWKCRWASCTGWSTSLHLDAKRHKHHTHLVTAVQAVNAVPLSHSEMGFCTPRPTTGIVAWRPAIQQGISADGCLTTNEIILFSRL
ncbi:hypothetical protein PAMP_017696 [Pampus punctatissimus]